MSQDFPAARSPRRFAILPVWASALALTLATGGAPAAAQPADGSVPAAPSPVPMPGETELARLVWATMVTIETANMTGNYTVLRDSSASGFQINNDPARLAQIFAGLRASGIDLSASLSVGPTYSVPPRMVQPGVLQVQGYFPLRPRAIVFDMAFQWQNGRWRLFGVSVEPRELAAPPSGK